MYSRSGDPRNREMRIPHNYSGNAFVQREQPVRATATRSTQPRAAVERGTPQRDIPEDRREEERCEDCPYSSVNEETKNAAEREAESERDDINSKNDTQDTNDSKDGKTNSTEHNAEHNSERVETRKPFSILSPIGDLGTEELLLIALALIIFQGGTEPELALILLALLFIN